MIPAPVSARVTSGGPWLGDTAKMWIGIVAGVLVFGLFIDWFRMKITPVRKVVDEAKVEQLAHEMADEQVSQLKEKLEKAEAAARQGKPAINASPQPLTPTPAITGPVNPTTPIAPPTRPAVAIHTAPKAATVPASGPTSRAARNEAYAAYVMLNPTRPTEKPDTSVTDSQIEQAMKRGVNWLSDQFVKTRLKNVEAYGEDIFPGADAISVYALLTAGQAVKDDRIRPGTSVVKNLLDGLKEMPIEAGKATYSRSLRISALGVMNRKEDRLTIENDARWLYDSSMQGAFTYAKPAPGALRSNGGWDNSNTQYGGLGLWAASEAGFHVPTQFWKDTEAHWIESQVNISGGWAYQGNNSPASLAMTCAGATMLMVARDQMAAEGTSFANVTAPLSKPLERALEWLDEGDHTIAVGSGGHYGYTLYGLERIGLASGYKFFGKHDWYRELAKKSLEMQQEDGSWTGGDTTAVETAFHLLFLARGQEPVFMAKLRFDGNWANRPRDVAALTRFAGKTLERTLNWQVVGTQRDWTDWTDAPVLLITSEDAPPLTESDVIKLRKYAQAGGLIFTHAENGSAKFNAFAADLAKKLFPDYPMTPLPATHGIYTAMFPLQSPPPLSGVTNGSRLLMVHSAGDLTKMWGARPDAKDRNRSVAPEMGVNIVVYATGKRDLRRRLDSPYVAERTQQPIATIPIARLRYDGNWDPEPWGWVRAARKFDRETSIGLDVRPVDIVALEPQTAPVAHLTGTAGRSFTDAEVKVLRDYVQAGGVLLIDACGGSQAFADSVRTSLLSRAFPQATTSVVGSGHPLMGHGRSWMDEIARVLTRGDTSQSRGLQTISAGKGAVVFTDLDISTGLLGTTTSGVSGYEPTVAENLVRNLVIWAIWPDGAPPMPETQTTKPAAK